MKKFNLYILLVLLVGLITLDGCKKKPPISDFLAQNCFKAKEVRENGAIVYTLGAAANTEPKYGKFKMVLNIPNAGVEYTQIDGLLTKGTWVFTGADSKLSISGLNPALTDAVAGTTTRTTASFTVSNYNKKTKEVTITSNDIDLKAGQKTVAYTLVPCE